MKTALSIPGVDGNPITIDPPGNLPSGGSDSLAVIIGVIAQFLIVFTIIAAFIYIVWGGFDWITSRGEKEKLKKAQQKIAMAIVGMLFAFFAFFIINFFSAIIGHGTNLLSLPIE